MKKTLLLVVGLECLLLVGGLAAYSLGALDRCARRPPPVPVFRPRIGESRIGDFVRYERRDRATGRVLGYLDYRVTEVFDPKGTTIGNIIGIHIRETTRDADGKEIARERPMRIQSRSVMHGFLPPRFEEEDDYPAGERPVVSRIATATFPLKDYPKGMQPIPPPVRGFLVEAVIPRRGLAEVAERYWMADEVPVFGIARWERGDEVLVLHTADMPERRG